MNEVSQLRAQQRLEALGRTGLMDTPDECAFDRAVRLATKILDTPVALVSLVDDKRQFFKAQQGLAEPYATSRQTPLTHSFCQHVVVTNAPLIIKDARSDARVQDNLAIRDLNVVAYLGIPIRDMDGHVLGSFCTISDQPREWNADEVATLKDIAAGIEAEIQLRQQLKKTEHAEQYLRLALRSGKLGTYDYDVASDQSVWDDRFRNIWGFDEDEGDYRTAARERIHPDDLERIQVDQNAAFDPKGKGEHHVEFRIVDPQTKDIKWIKASGQVMFENGVAKRMVGCVADVTKRRLAEEQSQLLTRELNHRVQNLFAVISGLVSLTARTIPDVKDMERDLRARIHALASAHALIKPAITGEPLEADKLTLQSLAETILQPHLASGDRVTMSGPKLILQQSAASGIALVLHELATNSAKYGSMSVPEGSLCVDWTISQVAEGETLQIDWRETSGPQIIEVPSRKGFGTTLSKLTIEGQLRGNIATDWRQEGVAHTLTVPLKSVVA